MLCCRESSISLAHRSGAVLTAVVRATDTTGMCVHPHDRHVHLRIHSMWFGTNLGACQSHVNSAPCNSDASGLAPNGAWPSNPCSYITCGNGGTCSFSSMHIHTPLSLTPLTHIHTHQHTHHTHT